jgi:hypothetical protein
LRFVVNTNAGNTAPVKVYSFYDQSSTKLLGLFMPFTLTIYEGDNPPVVVDTFTRTGIPAFPGVQNLAVFHCGSGINPGVSFTATGVFLAPDTNALIHPIK